MQSVVKDYYAELSSLRRLPATFLACPKKGGAKEGHPATILIRLARSSIMKHPLPFSLSPRGRGAGVRGGYHWETRPAGSDIRNASPSDSVACLDFRMGLTPNPARPGSGPMKFLGPRLGLRQRPSGRTRMSEALGRVCAGERTWP
jgi:hypothetical protein